MRHVMAVAKVTKYETFLNEKLRPDLKSCLEERDKIYQEIAEYSSLKKSIEALKSADLPAEKALKTKVDLGQNFYAKAKVPNHQKVNVDIGFGMFLQMNYNEALDFIEKKNRLLQDKADKLTEESTKIKASIKLVIHGLREIQGLSAEDLTKKPIYDPLS